MISMPNAFERDRFDVRKLFPDLPHGRQWFSTWDNGIPRELKKSEERDPGDPSGESVLRGKYCSLRIDGRGTARLDGVSPRLYVYDRESLKTWGNVEITFYAKRLGEYCRKSSQGFVAGARSHHHKARDNPCLGQTYYGRMLYDGRVNFQKELVHGLPENRGYTSPLPADRRILWGTADGQIPSEVWIGYKFAVWNSADGAQVHLRLYRDLSDGGEGGQWEELLREQDAGNWPVRDVGTCDCSPNAILTEPGRAIFVRNDLIEAAEYKRFSIREIIGGP